MRKLLFAFFLVLLFHSISLAQVQAKVGDQFAWDHDGLNLNHFETNIDFAESVWTNVGTNKIFTIPSLQLSLHTFYVRACSTNDSTLCSDPLSMQFVLFNPNIPSKPGNLRLISIPATTNPTSTATPTRLPVSPPVK